MEGDIHRTEAPCRAMTNTGGYLSLQSWVSTSAAYANITELIPFSANWVGGDP